MKKLTALLTILVLLMSVNAFAQIDPDADSMGIYFDLGATQTCTTTAAPFTAVTAYLMITNPSDPAGVSGWEATVLVSPNAVAPAWTLAAGLDVDGDPSNFQVGIGVAPMALPAAPAVMLATWVGYVLAPTDVVEFTVMNVAGSVSFAGTPGYASGSNAGTLIPTTVSSGFPYTVCAQVNACDVVANEDMSWGGVKALFQ